MLDRTPFVLFDGFRGITFARSIISGSQHFFYIISCLSHCVISYLENMLRCSQTYEIFGRLEPLESIICHSK